MGCCCLYTSSQTSNSIAQNTEIVIQNYSLTQLRVLKSNKSSCLYGCGKYQFIYYLQPLNNFTVDILELLLQRGFVRNSKYFRKYNHIESCCVGYNTRVIIEESQPTKKQKSIIDIFINQVIKQYPKIDFQNNSNVNKQDNYPLEMKQTNHQMMKKVQMHIQLEDIKELMIEVQQILIFCGKQINEELNMNLSFVIENQNLLKVFEKIDQLGYYSNHNLILYDQNINILKSRKIDQQQFNKILGRKLSDQVIMNTFKLYQHKNGYFNIQIMGREQTMDINQQINSKEVKKEKKMKQKREEIQQDKIEKANQTRFIDDKTFTVNNFRIGDMIVSIVDPYTSDENTTLYLNYMFEVHSQVSTREQFNTYYATRIIVADQVLHNKSLNIGLSLGQRFMEYRIRGKLIGCGVIVLTRSQLLSEYLFYDPKLKCCSFGIFASFVELEYMRQLQRYFPDFKYSSLSYVIATCKAMNYKLQFNGLEIQCPDSYVWLKYNKEVKKLMQSNSSKLNTDFSTRVNKNFDYQLCQVQMEGRVYHLHELDQQIQIYIIQILEQNRNVLGEDLLKGLTYCYQ